MKTLLLSLVSLALSTSAFASTGDNGFSCESHWYRDAKLAVNAYELTVQDSYMSGIPQMAKIIEEKIKLEDGKYSVRTIALTVSREQGVNCSASGLLVNCQGSAPKAYLSVSGWVYANGMSGELNLTVPVEVKDFQLKTSLGTNGPISIGGDKPTEIRFNYLNLDASAKVVVQGQEVDLAWETFFNPRNDQKSGSFCQKF